MNEAVQAVCALICRKNKAKIYYDIHNTNTGQACEVNLAFGRVRHFCSPILNIFVSWVLSLSGFRGPAHNLFKKSLIFLSQSYGYTFVSQVFRY